jgi:hypothetical protein
MPAMSQLKSCVPVVHHYMASETQKTETSVYSRENLKFRMSQQFTVTDDKFCGAVCDIDIEHKSLL